MSTSRKNKVPKVPQVITFHLTIKPLKLCESCTARKKQYDKKKDKLMRAHSDYWGKVHLDAIKREYAPR